MSGWRNTRRDNYQDSGHHQSSQTSSQQGGFTRRPYNDQHHHAGGHGGPRNLGRKGPKASRRFGLFGVTEKDRRKKQSIPLKSVSVQANIVDYFAHVEVTQQFVNLEENPIETTYTFPIAPNSAVCGFTAEIEGKKIVAEVKETEEAKDAYDDALSSGHGAYLGQEDRAAVFTVSVGNLPPGKEATIRITYVAELRLIGNKHKKNKVNKGDKNKLQLLPFEDNEQRLKFILPSRLAPKAKKPQQNSFGNAPPQPVHRFPEYTLTINVNLKTSRPFTGITSTQPVGMNFLSSKETQIWLSPLIKALKYDFTLLVSLPEEQKTQSYAVVEAPETPEGDYAVAFVLFPKEFLGTAKPGEAQPEKAAEQPKETKEAAPAAETKEEPEKTKDTPKEGAAAEQPAETKARPGQPSATDLVWNWPSGVQVQQTSLPVSVHSTRGFLLSYCSVPASAFSGDGVLNVTLSGKSNAGPVSLTLAVDSKAAVTGNLVHSLFGRARIRDLERVLKDKVEESIKSEVVSIAKRYSLASHYTSFVAVEERKEATQGTMVSRVVPLNAFGYAEVQASRRGQDQGGDSRRPAERHRQQDHYNRGGREDYQQRGGYGGRDRGDRDYREHRDDRREGGDRGGFYGGDRGDRGGDRGDRGGDRGDRGGDRGDRGGDRGRGGDRWNDGGRRGYDRGQDRHHQERRPKTLEVSADLAERLVAVKAKDGAHWNLTSTISEILGVPLTKLVDGLIGYPVSEYVSTIWATALVLACLRAHAEASKKHAALIADAEKWLSEEAEKHGFDGTDKWIKKATEYLVAIL